MKQYINTRKLVFKYNIILFRSYNQYKKYIDLKYKDKFNYYNEWKK